MLLIVTKLIKWKSIAYIICFWGIIWAWTCTKCTNAYIAWISSTQTFPRYIANVVERDNCSTYIRPQSRGYFSLSGQEVTTLLRLLEADLFLEATEEKTWTCIREEPDSLTLFVEGVEVASVEDAAEALLLAGMAAFVFHQKPARATRSFAWFMATKVFCVEPETAPSARVKTNMSGLAH